MGIKIVDEINTAIVTTSTRAGSKPVAQGGADRMSIYFDGTSGEGSQWLIECNYKGPSGATIAVGSATYASASGTNTGLQIMAYETPFAVGGTTHPAVPFPNQFVYTLETAGTVDTLVGTLFYITPD
jgi:hypothetical protein